MAAILAACLLGLFALSRGQLGAATVTSVDQSLAATTDEIQKIRIDEDAPFDEAAKDRLEQAVRRSDEQFTELEFALPDGGAQRFKTATFHRLFARASSARSSVELLGARSDALRALGLLRQGVLDFNRAVQADKERSGRLGRARTEMADILSADEFKVSRDHIGEALNRLTRYFQSFYTWFGISQTEAGTVSRLFLQLILVLGLAVLTAVLLRALSRRLAQGRVKPPPRSRRLVTSVRLDSPPAHASAAAQALAEGRFREAVHHNYLLVLATLERRRLVTFDRTRTNWEYHGQLVCAAADGPAALLGEMNRIYDRKWYGREPLTAEEARQFDGLARHLVSEVSDETS
jgi:hypothetical protein